MTSNQLLIQAFLKGDSEIFRHLYGTIFPKVARYVIQHGGSQEMAEDIFQNAITVLYVKLKNEKLHIQSFDNYLFIVCRNLWRREAIKNRVTNTAQETLVSEKIMNLTEFYIEQGQWDLFQEKLKELSQNCQDILKMLFQKVSYKEMVVHFGYASETVVRQRMFKCKAKLIQLIKDDARYVRLSN
ncbi:MAG: sigma-70 family RNA polymerase sigma factor [Flavobacteriaceae bacterium]